MTIATVGRDSEDSSERVQVLQVEWKTDFGRPQFRTVQLPNYLGICRFVAQLSSIGAHTPSRTAGPSRETGSDGMQWQASSRMARFTYLPPLVFVPWHCRRRLSPPHYPYFNWKKAGSGLLDVPCVRRAVGGVHHLIRTRIILERVDAPALCTLHIYS